MKFLKYSKPLALILTLGLLAQTNAPSFALARHAVALQESEVVIPDGTEFTVETTEEISSKTATEGDPVNLKVTEDLKIDGHVVIAAGTMVKGVISNAKKAGRMGRGGELNLRIESTLTVDKQKIKLRAAKGREGDDKTGTTVALVVLFGPLGFLKRGKNAKIKAGTRVKVYTDEEKRIKIPAV
jgi:hypothetical protein